MKTLCLLVSLTFAILLARGSNNFAGFALSNSASGTSYTCRTQAQWNKIAKDAKSAGFESIRLTGFDCNSLEMASSAAAAQGLTILAGIFYTGTAASSKSSIFDDVETFKNAFKKYGHTRYLGLTVGNEVDDTPSNIIAAVNEVRENLEEAEIYLSVSTVHIWVNIRDNPIFCDADFIGANAHAFYDGGQVTADNAGNFVFKIVVPALKAACPGKKIMITESGWPSRGSAYGAAVASIDDERAALIALNCASREDPSISVFAFEYDDQLWKANDNEQSFGMFEKLAFNGAGDILQASC